MEQKKTVRAEGAVKRMSTSTVAFLLAAVLIFGCAIGGTLAWLTGKAKNEVVNTFVLGNISLKLSQGTDEDTFSFEHTNFVAGSGAKSVPAKLTIGADSAKSYVYVVIVESADFQLVAEYLVGLGDGWGELSSTVDATSGEKTTVYFREHDGQGGKEYNILQGATYADGEVCAKSEFGDISQNPDVSLTFYAYAIQYDGIYDSGKTPKENAAKGWEELVAHYGIGESVNP